jgi:glucose/arabinose dehydrogenase
VGGSGFARPNGVVLRATVIALMAAGGLAVADAVELIGHSFRPARREATEERIRQLGVPSGFTVTVFARGLGNPRMLGVGDDGTVYVSRPDTNDVVALRTRNGHADGEPRPVLTNLEKAHGLAIAGSRLYAAGVKKVVVADLRVGGVGEWRTIVDDLPDGGQHGKRTIGVGPDGMLYISIGSSCNTCDETNPEHATLLKVPLAGGRRAVFARGLRNTIGFAWHPETQELWGMDHGSDWRGDDQPPEELNKLVEGSDYGWPLCYGERHLDPYFDSPQIEDKAGYCRQTQPSMLSYQAHSAPIAMVFYTGTLFPAEYRHDAFVAMRGSWNREPATGYKVVRIRFRNGQPMGFEDFLRGFLIEDGQGHFGRVAGLAVMKDGALLVSDDANGIIYRVGYGAPGTAR